MPHDPISQHSGDPTAGGDDHPLVAGTPDWMLTAACRGLDLGEAGDLFFPEHGTGQGSGAARRICASCAVRAECADYAIEHRIWHGIWGGLSTRSRRRIAAERERLAS